MLFQVSELHQLHLLHPTHSECLSEFIDVVLRQKCVALSTLPHLNHIWTIRHRKMKTHNIFVGYALLKWIQLLLF